MAGVVRPVDVDAWCQASGVTLAALRRAIPNDCFAPVPWRSWFALGRIVVSLAAGIWALSLVPLTSGRDLSGMALSNRYRMSAISIG